VSGCDRKLGSYLDGELGAQERASVEAHVAACAGCRGELDELRADGDSLRRALGGLLLHLDMPRLVMAELPEKRKSKVMTQIQGVRRRMAMAGFAVAATFMIASFVRTGPQFVFNLLSESQQTALFLNWALALAAGSMLIWPEKIAWLESRALAPFRRGAAEVSPHERVLVQGVGLLFLCVATAVHFLLMRSMGV
jgi:anti-sigma factor RsiW